MPLSTALHKRLCLCHIVRHFDYQKLVFQFLGFYNIQYDEDTQGFKIGHQIFVYTIYTWNIICCILYIVYESTFVIEARTFLAYTLPCIHYIKQKNAILRTMNEMMQVHLDLQSIMGTMFCVSVERAFCFCWLILLEILGVLYCQISSYQAVQIPTMCYLLVCWYFQLLIQVNSYIWLQSIYVVMNQVLIASLGCSKRWRMLKKVLKIHRRLGEIQRDITSYMGVYILSLMVLISGTLCNSVIVNSGFDLNNHRLILMRLEKWEIRYLGNLFLLIITLLMVVGDYKTKRNKFLEGLSHTKLLYERILDCRDSKRNFSRCQYPLDSVDLMLLTGNQPRELMNSKLTLWQLKLESSVLFSSEAAPFINYLGLLMVNICLIPFVAICNGFELSLEERLAITLVAHHEDIDANYSLTSYVLSRAFGK
ncbi:hypothetical protein KR009_008416 [Drosophila setifemur]|nr:hypothetical protein KR009_008416 [Drosophila setifemur]